MRALNWGLGAILLGSVHAQAASAAPCTLALTSPLVITSPDVLGGLIFDPQCQHLYVSDASANQLLVVNLSTGTLGTPIPVGSSPRGMDFSPDGTTLYVANSTGNSLSVINVATATEISRIAVPGGFLNDSPLSVAVNAAGKVFFSMTFSGSGFGGQMMEYDPVTASLRQRTDFYFFGLTTEATYLAASGDRSKIGIVAGDISSGPVFMYSTATDTFTPEHDTQAFVNYIALDGTGSTVLVDPNGYVFDGNLTLNGTLSDLGLGAAVDPAGAVGYQVSGANINVLDLKHITVTKTLPLGDTTNNGFFYNTVGQLAISGDGALLAAITDSGMAIVPSGIVHFVPFASFTASTEMELDAVSADTRFKLRGNFTLGAASKGITPATSPLQLTVGSVTVSLPAGALTPVGQGYAFNGQVNGGTLRLLLEPNGANAYKLITHGSGFDLTGTTIPVPVALTIGSDTGRAQLGNGEAELSTFAPEPEDSSADAALSAATAGSSSLVSPRGRDDLDRRGNLVHPATSPSTGCAYSESSVGAAPGSPAATCVVH